MRSWNTLIFFPCWISLKGPLCSHVSKPVHPMSWKYELATSLYWFLNNYTQCWPIHDIISGPTYDLMCWLVWVFLVIPLNFWIILRCIIPIPFKIADAYVREKLQDVREFCREMVGTLLNAIEDKGNGTNWNIVYDFVLCVYGNIGHGMYRFPRYKPNISQRSKLVLNITIINKSTLYFLLFDCDLLTTKR